MRTILADRDACTSADLNISFSSLSVALIILSLSFETVEPVVAAAL